MEKQPTKQEEELSENVKQALSDLGIKHFILHAIYKYEVDKSQILECGHPDCHPAIASSFTTIHSDLELSEEGDRILHNMVENTLRTLEQVIRHRMVNSIARQFFGERLRGKVFHGGRIEDK